MAAERVQIIAEAGVNHNGSLQRALQLIDVAAEAGVDAVKYQTFRSEKVISRGAVKAAYQVATTGGDESQLDMVRKLELDANAHHQLVAHCKHKGVVFLSTPFDLESLALLQTLHIAQLKIPSGEITNPILLRAGAATGLPIILSTGMSTLGEIEAALGLIASELLKSEGRALSPSEAFASDLGQTLLKAKVTLLHCTTEYPAPVEDVNLRAMQTMATAFGLRVGYSDHTPGISVSIAAVALGALVIEKHFTLDRNLPGPDHKASLEPQELRDLVSGIRMVEQALGHGRKLASPSEQKNIAIARRSLVAARAIKRGERFTSENLTTKRPGSGVTAMRYDEWLGKAADRDYAEDELIGG